jgi:hypothetical protein
MLSGSLSKAAALTLAYAGGLFPDGPDPVRKMKLSVCLF